MDPGVAKSAFINSRDIAAPASGRASLRRFRVSTARSSQKDHRTSVDQRADRRPRASSTSAPGRSSTIRLGRRQAAAAPATSDMTYDVGRLLRPHRRLTRQARAKRKDPDLQTSRRFQTSRLEKKKNKMRPWASLERWMRKEEIVVSCLILIFPPSNSLPLWERVRVRELGVGKSKKESHIQNLR